MITWRRAWQPIPVFLPRESHRQRSLVGYSTWGHKESDTIEQITLSLFHRVRKWWSWEVNAALHKWGWFLGEAASSPAHLSAPPGLDTNLPAASPAAGCRSWPCRRAWWTGSARSSARWCSAGWAAAAAARRSGHASRTGGRWCSLPGSPAPGNAASWSCLGHSAPWHLQWEGSCQGGRGPTRSVWGGGTQCPLTPGAPVGDLVARGHLGNPSSAGARLQEHSREGAL